MKPNFIAIVALVVERGAALTLGLGLAGQALAVPDIRVPTFSSIARFEAERDFIVGQGIVEPGRVRTHNDRNRAGDTLAGIVYFGGRGVPLAEGVYRWRFRVGRMGDPAFLPSSPVWTLSIHDVTTGTAVATRRIDASELGDDGSWHDRFLMHSTAGRSGHRFEARVTWNGMVNAIVDFVELEQAREVPGDDLEIRAETLDRTLRERFLDPLPGLAGPGQLVARHLGRPRGADDADQRGDSFTWTALYTAAQAMRLRARPGDREAQSALEQGFRALLAMQAITGEPGVLPRYVDAQGRWLYADRCDGRWKSGRLALDPATGAPSCQPAETSCAAAGDRSRAMCPNGQPLYEEWGGELISEDIYAAYAFAVGQGYELITDPNLREAVRNSMSVVADTLLERDLRIVKAAAADGSARAKVLDFNPYYSEDVLRDVLDRALDKNDGLVPQIKKIYTQYDELRARYNDDFLIGVAKVLIGTACSVRLPSIDGLLPPFSNELFAAIDAKDTETIIRLLPGFLTSLRGSLDRLNAVLTETSTLFWRAHRCIGRYPGRNPLVKYMFVAQFVDSDIRPTLAALTNNLPRTITRLSDVKFDAANALTAASLLASATLVDARFQPAYLQALGGPQKELLATIDRWAGVDETVARYSGGDKGADRARSDTNWKSLAALTNLAVIEARRGAPLAAAYQSLLARTTAPTRDEGNALYDAMRAYAGIAGFDPVDSGLLAWNLAILPTERVGMASADWLREIDNIRLYTGELLEWNADTATGFARDPLPSSVRALNNIFLWQRNPRKLGAQDYNNVATPSLDYLLAYWMARAAGIEVNVPR